MNNTGGAADAIFHYCASAIVVDSKFESKVEQLAAIRRLHEASGDRIITFFNVDDDVEMSTMLLMAIVKNIKPLTKDKTTQLRTNDDVRDVPCSV